ncbi:hypothetical protein KIPB_009785, partial [Kipferlia bialata]|eukprot:g9785.t1
MPGKAKTISCFFCSCAKVKYSDKKGFRLLSFQKRVVKGERVDCASHLPSCSTPLPSPDLHNRAEKTSHIPPSLFDERFASLGGLIKRMDNVTGGLWVPTGRYGDKIISCSACRRCKVAYTTHSGYQLRSYVTEKVYVRVGYHHQPKDDRPTCFHREWCPFVTGEDVHITHHYVPPLHAEQIRYDAFVGVLRDNLSLWHNNYNDYAIVTRSLDSDETDIRCQ